MRRAFRASKRRSCPADGRGQLVVATDAGRDMRRRMWDVYGPALHEAVGRRLSAEESEGLAALLGRLILPPPEAPANVPAPSPAR